MGVPSILINNATYSLAGTLDEIDAPQLDAHYGVNVRATTLLCAEFARHFRGRQGRIINLTSGQFQRPMSTEVAYAVTKGAIDALTCTIASTLAGRDITVNAVNPGPTDTGWMSATVRESLRQRFPAGRVGQPEDAAQLVAFLASEAANWITGQVLHSEGGFY